MEDEAPHTPAADRTVTPDQDPDLAKLIDLVERMGEDGGPSL